MLRTIRTAFAFSAILAVSLAFALAQENPLVPHSGYEPPMAAAAATLTASATNVPPDLLTTGEKTQWKQTARYDEAIRIMRRLAALSPEVKVIQFGTTPQGRAMYAMIVSSDKAFTPAAAAKTNKAVILIQSGIHAGEIMGKDVALMLVRDMVITKTRAPWLKNAIFLVIPVFNVDGHEDRSAFNRPNQNGPDITGTRDQTQGLNLNRDYIKGATQEMRGWLALYQAWMPDFMFDNHVTDGADYQYDLTWDMAHHEDIGEPTRSWVNNRYIPEMNKRMEAGGHLVMPYGALRGGGNGEAGQFGTGGGGGQQNAAGQSGASAAARPGNGGQNGQGGNNARQGSSKREFFLEVFSPRYSHEYTAALNRPCLLVETHSLKDPKTRAWSDYDIMVNSIDIVTEDPQSLRTAIREADAKDAALAGDRNAPPIYLGGKTSVGGHPFIYRGLKTATFQSEITGTPVVRYTAEKEDLDTIEHDGIDTTTEAQEPLGFIVPLQWKEIADELKLQGVQMETIPKELDQDFETWRFSNVKFVNANEAGLLADYTLQPVKEKVEVPAGSWWVPLHQQRARLIMALLHPAAPDALIRYGFGASVFQTGGGGIGANPYLSVPIATKVAEEHPEWMQEFESKVKSDPAFAADPQARINWWTSRSNYEPSDINRYPVLQVWEKNW